MNRWLLAVVLGVSSFLTGAFFEAMSENSRTIDFDKIGGTAFCRVANDSTTIGGLTQSDIEQQNYLQTARRLVVFKKILSGARRFLVLYSDSSPGTPITVVRKAAEKLGVELDEHPVKSDAQLKAALQHTTTDKVDGIFHMPDDWVDRHANLIFAAARMRRLATMTFGKVYVTQGALASYGTELYKCELQRNQLSEDISVTNRSNHLAIKLIQRSFMEINLKTAKEIGLAIPLAALSRADRLIN
jgi:putative ABC transport system substrate-binding protein